MKKYFLMIMMAFGVFAQEDLSIDDSFLVEDTVNNNSVGESNTDSFALFEEADRETTIAEVTAELLKKSVTLTGDFGFDASYLNYDKGSTNGSFSGTMKSDLFLDVRLTAGIKGYTSLALKKSNDDVALPDEKFLSLNEMFFDYNIKEKTYIRLGKQNLSWGRGYFFNPSDLINIGSKSIDDLMGKRTGNFGVKIHVPKGVTQNFYTYIKMEDKKNIDELDLALKYEFLIDKTEYSIAVVRLGEEKDTVASLDFASSFKGAQTFGEFTMQNGEEVSHYKNGIASNLDGKLVLKGSVGYSKTFDDIGKDEDKKSIMLIQEIYYNGAGYEDGHKEVPKTVYYNPYSDGQFYLATFLTFNKFINKDTTLTLNLLDGFSDEANQISGSYSYRVTDDLSLGANLMGYFGSGSSSTSATPNYVLGFSADLSF